MIKSKFFNTVATVATAGVLASVVASPAFAEDNVCLPEDEANISEVKGKGLDVFDFTKSSGACLKHYVSDISQSNLVLIARNDTVAWQDATVAAAQLIQSEARVKNKAASVFVAYFTDDDGLDTTADNELWANGVQRSSTPISTKNGVTIGMISTSEDAFQGVVDYIHEEGESVWNRYLKRDEKK